MKQGQLLLLVVVSLLFAGCVGGKYEQEAQRNRANLIELKIGLTKNQVRELMGTPYKVESYTQDGKILEFWLYITEPKSFPVDALLDSNITPLAFENGILKGWGRNYYDTILRIKKDITIEQK